MIPFRSEEIATIIIKVILFRFNKYKNFHIIPFLSMYLKNIDTVVENNQLLNSYCD